MMRGCAFAVVPVLLAALDYTAARRLVAKREYAANPELSPLQDKCDLVVFEAQNKALQTRTMVVELNNKEGRQRALVLTHANDTSEPCALRWWLDHDPQGLVSCSSTTPSGPDSPSKACPKGTPCVPNADDIWNGYVRTMLATVVYTPKPQKGRAFLQGDGQGWQTRSGFRAGRVAVLGLGSSTMALWMRKHMPTVGLSVAELVDGVANSAPCFGLNVQADKGLEIKVSDGRAFLADSPDAGFDAILVDAFDSDLGLPTCFKTKEFFELTARKLAPGGALAFNALVYQKETKRVLASLRSGFAENSAGFYVGRAPGADGIQEVVVGFKKEDDSLGAQAQVPFPQDAEFPGMDNWLEQAEFRQLKTGAEEEVEPVSDAEHHCGAAATTKK